MEDAARQLLATLRGRGIDDERVLTAVAETPRAAFVDAGLEGRAWDNEPLPIGQGQTISQPLMVARMLALLELGPTDRVLDVGTGSGWHAALLARLAGEVWSVERHAELAARAAAVLAGTGVHVVHGDGAAGLPEHAPFDAINVAAAAKAGVPGVLEEQLAEGGRLIAPVGAGEDQWLVRVRRRPGGTLEREQLEPVRFVPLV